MNSYRPFDPDRPLFSSRCSCGRHASDADHALDLSGKIDEEKASASSHERSYGRLEICELFLSKISNTLP